MKFNRFVLVGIVVGIVGMGAIYIGLRNIPQTSEVFVTERDCVLANGAEQCVQFPTINGQNLPGDDFTLPDDFEGQYVFLVIPFNQDQQVRADTWLPFAQELRERFEGLRFYNVPIFPQLSDAIRLFARTGMNIAITDRALREVTITVFLEDREAFLKAMEIPDVEKIRVFLLDHEGAVLWRGADEYSEEQGQQLIALLDSVDI